jgi:hypothetical protein
MFRDSPKRQNPQSPNKAINKAMPKSGLKKGAKKIAQVLVFRATCKLLKELWLYALNPTAIKLSSEAMKTLRRLAIDRGMPPEYFFTGFQSFSATTVHSLDIESLKLYRHLSNRIWEYNEKMFLVWWHSWLQFYLQIFLKQKRMGMLQQRKKGWLELNWENLLWEEEHEPYIVPVQPSAETVWLEGLNKVKSVYEPLTPAIKEFLPSQREYELKWEGLYNHYSKLNAAKEKTQTIVAEYQAVLETVQKNFLAELEKLHLQFTKPILQELYQILMQRFSPEVHFKRLKMASSPLPLFNTAEEKRRLIQRIQEKQSKTIELQLRSTLLETAEFTPDQIDQIINYLLQIASDLSPELLRSSEDVEVEFSNLAKEIEKDLTAIVEFMQDMLQPPAAKPELAARAASPSPKLTPNKESDPKGEQ